MHQVLAIPELFDLIVEECTSSPKTLVNLAATCRRFSESSLNTLYESATADLSVLLEECLPELLDTDITELLDIGSLDCFSKLTTKIRHLKISGTVSDHSLLALYVVSQLYKLENSPKLRLFSRLKSLTVDRTPTIYLDEEESSPDDLYNNLADLSPKFAFITSTSLEQYIPEMIGHSNSRYLHLKLLVVELGSNLETFKMSCSGCDELDVYPDMYACYCTDISKSVLARDHQFLKVLDIDLKFPDLALMQKILTLPNLDTLGLHISLPNSNYEPLVEIKEYHAEGLSSLRALHLSAEDHIFTPVLIAIAKNQPQLAELDLTLGDTCFLDPDYEFSPYRAFRDILSSCLLSLKKLYFHVIINFGPLYYRGIQPLASCLLIEEIKLRLPKLKLQDSDVLSLVQEMRRLQVLDLGEVSGLSLSCLIHFSVNCECLHSLSIRFDYVAVPEIPDFLDMSLFNKVLHKLEMYSRGLEASADLAIFIRTIFPCIQMVNCDSVSGKNTFWEKCLDEMIKTQVKTV